ncbi:MAG: NUDIX domain-containing protein [Candidatus Woesearchaeota archaeon]
MRYATTAFIFYNNKLLVTLHKKIGKWLHVGGHVESGEDFEESLIREIKEETGLDVEILNLEHDNLFNYFFYEEENFKIKPLIKPLFIHKTVTSKQTETILDYVCIAKSDNVKLQEKELLEYRWISKKEIETLDSFPHWKALAKRAFEVYEKNKKISLS